MTKRNRCIGEYSDRERETIVLFVHIPLLHRFIVDKEPGEVHLLFSLLPPFPEGASSKVGSTST